MTDATPVEHLLHLGCRLSGMGLRLGQRRHGQATAMGLHSFHGRSACARDPTHAPRQQAALGVQLRLCIRRLSAPCASGIRRGGGGPASGQGWKGVWVLLAPRSLTRFTRQPQSLAHTVTHSLIRPSFFLRIGTLSDLVAVARLSQGGPAGCLRQAVGRSDCRP
jgi:hypothetical protein